MLWKQAKVSQDLSHHQINGQPIYQERFDAVMKFHDPGLAPVKKNDYAWHIRPDGQPAYRKKFLQTFGFYEDAASVIDISGAFHIVSDGSPLYKERYDWTGNFQENRCPVRTQPGLYCHIDMKGNKIGPTCWHYAGDYKDGIAVIQRKDGLSTHVDIDGNLIHNKWFEDLDIFHKGYACAKDRIGWVHINRHGQAAYPERYTMIEPFYNGQARVETELGALCIIDESGHCLHKLRHERDLFHELSRDLVGFWTTHTISTAVDLGVFEQLPESMAALIKRIHMPSDNLKRLLNALWNLNLCHPSEQNKWSLTKKGEFLQKNHPRSLADAALEYATRLEPMWFLMSKALKNEDWVPEMDIFQDICRDPNAIKQHHNALASYAKTDYPNIVSILPITDGQSILDVGGSHGVLSKEIKDAFPESNITVLDLPQVLSNIQIPDGITSHPADFFKAWKISADIVIMSRILHDWNDLNASIILKNTRDAVLPEGKLLIVEMILEESIPDGHLCDLHLLAVSGGKERTLHQYHELLNINGFTIVSVYRNNHFLSVIEAKPNEKLKR